MSHKHEDGDSELTFSKTIHDVAPGEYEYKFRLGPGDWWVLDENAETGKFVALVWTVHLRAKSFQSPTMPALKTTAL